MRNALAVLAVPTFLFIGGAVIYHTCQYGRQWHFVNGTPELILGADGVSYPDGSKVADIELAMHRAGTEHAFWLILYAVGLFLIEAEWKPLRRLFGWQRRT